MLRHFKRLTPQLEHEYRILDDARGTRWILDRGIGVRDAAGRVTKVVGALSDITERKLEEISLRRARDEAREALGQQSAVSEILRVMSRSPTDSAQVVHVDDVLADPHYALKPFAPRASAPGYAFRSSATGA